MERSFREKFLKKFRDALDPQAGRPLQSDGLQAQAPARPEEADQVALEVGGRVSYGNATLAIIVVPEKS
jgi:hypothetical protein